MLRCHLSRLMGEKKVRIADVAAATGIHRNMLSLLYQETAVRVELASVEALCRYFNIPVGELFELVNDHEVRQHAVEHK